MRTVQHEVDFCVVGGGIAGMCAAIAAARHGVKTLLMHDRPVLGGNASSEIRMWICGAHGENNLETGIIEEIRLENLYRNNYPNYSVWDSILYEKVRFQENLTLLLNCSCHAAEMEGDRIKSISGWQLTSETRHEVEAAYFADCSGDSILAPLSGAEFRYGREASGEFGESIEPEQADDRTMGMSCLIQCRETGSPQKFIPPAWANKYTRPEDLPNRSPRLSASKQNFWWLEIGGEQDTVHDCEEIRDELLKIAFGIWDYIKNYSGEDVANWALDWVGFLPGKRESRRYLGDHIVTQNDVEAGGKFEDIVAYGGWSMDDHHPAGIKHPGKPTIFHPAPSPYGIPYRALYSGNIANLFFAGRNISATHAAMSSARVMATCGLLGQAAGTAAAVAVKNVLSPREVYQRKLGELQAQLQADDCWLPGKRRAIPELCRAAELLSSVENTELVRNGFDRPDGDEENCCRVNKGDYLEYRFGRVEAVKEIRIIFDSDLNRDHLNMVAQYPLNMPEFKTPETLIRSFVLSIENERGETAEIFRTDNNYQRLFRLNTAVKAQAVRLTVLE
ncbi:MAG: FAD-dependent oxidoreductase, partial [Victivallaceae bacterium]|nr:FAD-dependent oxidoreductase [Victivallaceae bacterium]